MNRSAFRVVTLGVILALSSSAFATEADDVEDHHTQFREKLMNGPIKDLDEAHEQAKKAKTHKEAAASHEKAGMADLNAAMMHLEAAKAERAASAK